MAVASSLLLSDHSGRFNPVASRHGDVHQDGIEATLLECFNRLETVSGCYHSVTMLLQQTLCEVPVGGTVVSD